MTATRTILLAILLLCLTLFVFLIGTYYCQFCAEKLGPRTVSSGLPEFVADFDRLTPEDVVWEPYSELAINTRAPIGISSVCFQDQAFWMTTTALVYDVYIEAHCPDRVRRQFGQRQLYPVPSALDRVERHDHR